MILRISACLSCYFVDFFLYFRHFSLSFSCFGWLFWWFWGFQLAFPAQLVDFFFYFRHFSLPSLPTSVTSILVSIFQSFYQLSPWQYSIPDKKIQKNSLITPKRYKRTLSSLQIDTQKISQQFKQIYCRKWYSIATNNISLRLFKCNQLKLRTSKSTARSQIAYYVTKIIATLQPTSWLVLPAVN